MLRRISKDSYSRSVSAFLRGSVATFVFVLFLFLNTFSVSNSFNKFSSPTKNLHSKSGYTYTGGAFIKQFQSNLPLDSAPNSNEKEIANENELGEDTDDILDFLSYLYAFNHSSILSGKNFYFHQLKQTLQNCNTIALFVLHHSWKSFLS